MKVPKAALAALPLLASLLVLPASVSASTLSSGSGSFTATGQVISVHQADGNTIVTATEVQTLTGALTGTRMASGTMTFHPDGTFTAHDTGTFTGTIDGRTGSITISGASTGTGNTGTGQITGDRARPGPGAQAGRASAASHHLGCDRDLRPLGASRACSGRDREGDPH